MQKIAFATTIFFCSIGMVHAQWSMLQSHTTADLRGIHNVGGGIVWASGSNGTVLRSEDAGYLWQPCTIPPGAEKLDFRGIQGFDANTAIVMSSGKGDLSRLYKTTDGCRSWKLVFTNPDKEGFWDAIRLTRKDTLVVIGDPVKKRKRTTLLPNHRSGPTFPMFASYDGGSSWRKSHDDILFAATDKNGTPVESIFAASNSSFLPIKSRPETVFVTGGRKSYLHYLQFMANPPDLLCKGPCTIASETTLGLASAETAGGFSLAANDADKNSIIVVVVGGDYKIPDSNQNIAAICSHKLEGVFVRYHCDSAISQPRGYRSAVAYDADLKTWITVGPNGTDISTDDGRNWRAVHPDAMLHEAPDADRNWNALSLPFVVGPRGRIGKLDAAALKDNK